MAEKIATQPTTLTPEDVIVRAVQFFSTEKWRATSQSGRTATFEGKVPIPWGMMILMILGFLFCFVPGLIIYFALVRKVHRFHNLVVTANPTPTGSEVTIRHPDHAKKLVTRFIESLPPHG